MCLIVCEFYLEGRSWQRRHRAGPRRAAAARPGAGVRSVGWRAAAASLGSFLGDGEPQTGTEVVVIPPSLVLYVWYFFLFLFFVFFYARELQRKAHGAVSRTGRTGAQPVHTLRTVIRGRAKDSGASGERRRRRRVCSCTVRV